MKKKKPISFIFRYLKLISMSLLVMISALTADQVHIAYILSKVGSNTVFITNPEGAELRGSATGFEVIAPSGRVYTLTNQHVCALQKDGFVMVGEKRDSRRFIPRRIIEVYDENDLCLVEGLPNYEGLTLADSYNIGDLNYAIGYPLGASLNLTSGYLKEVVKVSIPMQEIPLEQCVGKHLKINTFFTFFGPVDVCTIERQAIDTNITIHPGNSGSPMVNALGHVTGVIFASNNRTNWGCAVPLEFVVEFLKPY